MTLRQLLNGWHSFLFSPQSPTPVALYRIFFGLLMLQVVLVHIDGYYLFWYGPHAIVSIDTVKHYFWQNTPRFDLLLLIPNTEAWFMVFFYAFVVACVFLTLGFCTRLSSIFVCLGFISLSHHDPFNLNGGDEFLRLASIFLAFSHAGDAFSIDQLIRKRLGIKTSERSQPWAQRLIQLQLAIAYCQTFFCKISGDQWLDLTAVYYATRLDDMYRFRMPFLDSLPVLKLLTAFTLIVEFAMWTLVWFKELRYYILASAVILHFGIELTINLPVFEWAFITALITFVDGDDLDRLILSLKSKAVALTSRTTAA